MSKASQSLRRTDLLSLDQRLTYGCLIVATLLSRFLAPMWLERYGLTIINWRVLAIIGRFAPMSAKDIVAVSSTDAFYVSRAVDQLARRGLIRREQDPEDRRRARFQLSREGAIIHDKGERAISRVETALLSRFEESERQAFMEMLGRLDLAAQELQRSSSWHDFA